ncbi:MAG: hypothetical protein ACRERS_01870, partial [Methylococcales bacterium]
PEGVKYTDVFHHKSDARNWIAKRPAGGKPRMVFIIMIGESGQSGSFAVDQSILGQAPGPPAICRFPEFHPQQIHAESV